MGSRASRRTGSAGGNSWRRFDRVLHALSRRDSGATDACEDTSPWVSRPDLLPGNGGPETTGRGGNPPGERPAPVGYVRVQPGTRQHSPGAEARPRSASPQPGIGWRRHRVSPDADPHRRAGRKPKRRWLFEDNPVTARPTLSSNRRHQACGITGVSSNRVGRRQQLAPFRRPAAHEGPPGAGHPDPRAPAANPPPLLVVPPWYGLPTAFQRPIPKRPCHGEYGYLTWAFSGRCGIRTHGDPEATTAFEAAPFVRSGNLPGLQTTSETCWLRRARGRHTTTVRGLVPADSLGA